MPAVWCRRDGSHSSLPGSSDVEQLKEREEGNESGRASGSRARPVSSQPRRQNELKIVATRLPSVSRPHMVACFSSFSLEMHRPHVATGFVGSDCCGEREMVESCRMWPYDTEEATWSLPPVTPIACSGWGLVAAVLGPQVPLLLPLLVLLVLLMLAVDWQTGSLDRRSPLDGIMLSGNCGEAAYDWAHAGPLVTFPSLPASGQGGPWKLGLLLLGVLACLVLGAVRAALLLAVSIKLL